MPFYNFAQTQISYFVSQDSLLAIYYTPKIRWADSIVQVVKQHAAEYFPDEVYRLIHSFYLKKEAAILSVPPYYNAPHYATLFDERKTRLLKKVIKK
ncbi:MAG: hypothetical protein RMJ87_11010 [Cytophagales bacterium]|nr:hypothetical protein [Bernardetiaceae bacterium]MDW8205550.1 hypothetical protein [Cytophagales bacterium]